MNKQNKQFEDLPLILSVNHIAEILQVSKRVAHEIMNENSFPLLRIRRCKRVSKDRFFEWLEKKSKTN
jgi:hypothetical protein